jgi:hypothetical protein
VGGRTAVPYPLPAAAAQPALSPEVTAPAIAADSTYGKICKGGRTDHSAPVRTQPYDLPPPQARKGGHRQNPLSRRLSNIEVLPPPGDDVFALPKGRPVWFFQADVKGRDEHDEPFGRRRVAFTCFGMHAGDTSESWRKDVGKNIDRDVAGYHATLINLHAKDVEALVRLVRPELEPAAVNFKILKRKTYVLPNELVGFAAWP